MKIQNPIKLIIKFFGGGLINFPTRHIRWIKVEPVNGGDIPSGDTTIDDVVKFLHDDLEKNAHPLISKKFPYTTWDDIPDYEDVNNGDYCKSNDSDQEFSDMMLYTPSYVIGIKGSLIPPVG